MLTITKAALVFVFILFFLSPTIARAINLHFDGLASSITENEELTVNYLLECSSCKDSYLRAVFYKEGTTNYFGFTQNEKGEWINTTADKTLYFHLTADDLKTGSNSGLLKVKADLDSPYFNGAGIYLFKIGRYTSANSSASWSDNQGSIQINVKSTPTPSPTTTSSSSSTSMPSSSLSSSSSQTSSLKSSSFPTSPASSFVTSSVKTTPTLTPTVLAATTEAEMTTETPLPDREIETPSPIKNSFNKLWLMPIIGFSLLLLRFLIRLLKTNKLK